MAVDANVIIFARVKEELTAGKSVHASLKSGFQKAMSAIVDGNITTLIAAGVLWLRGSGTVKGFAQTLALGIVVSMFTALVITRLIIFAFYGAGIRNEKVYGRHLKERKPVDFLGKKKISKPWAKPNANAKRASPANAKRIVCYRQNSTASAEK